MKSTFLSAQESVQDSSVRFFGVPLIFYTPDTYWGAGAAGILTYPGRPLRSSVSFSLAYTQRKQFLLWLPYQWYSPKGQWRAYGELGWYRYLYQYFGIGNRYADDFKEVYTAIYPRVRVTGLHKLGRRQLGGIRYSMDAYRIAEKQLGGELSSGNIPGSSGGFSSGVGPVWLLDSRDNQFFPRRGLFLESFIQFENKLTGSDFKYTRFSLEVTFYKQFLKNKILVLNALSAFSSGETPFFQMPQIGGTRRLRGYPDGKFRDKHLLLVQAECRFPLIWRFKGALFGGAGSVFGTPGESLRWRPNWGGGLRFEFDRRQNIHLRADYGFGEGSSGFYLTVGEAF